MAGSRDEVTQPAAVIIRQILLSRRQSLSKDLVAYSRFWLFDSGFLILTSKADRIRVAFETRD